MDKEFGKEHMVTLLVQDGVVGMIVDATLSIALAIRFVYLKPLTNFSCLRLFAGLLISGSQRFMASQIFKF